MLYAGCGNYQKFLADLARIINQAKCLIWVSHILLYSYQDLFNSNTYNVVLLQVLLFFIICFICKPSYFVLS